MDLWLEADLAVLMTAMLLTGIIIPQILLIAFRKKLFDEHNVRKTHRGIVPRLGGIAFMPAIIFAIALVMGIAMKGDYIVLTSSAAASSVGLMFLLCSVTVMFLIGITDDLIGVRYRAKFIVQAICGVLIVLAGIGITDFHGLLWLHSLPTVLTWIFTIFIVVFLVNSINLIDGIDGLASGLSIVAVIFYGVMLHICGMQFYSMIAWATLGTMIPFFYYNVFGNPMKRKKIFMGDTGSLTIGMILTFLSLSVAKAPNVVIDRMDFNPVILAFSPLIIPAFDVVRVYLHRVINNRNPFLPDRSHIHHKLLALGCPQRWAMIVILSVSVLFTLANILLSPYIAPTWIVLGDIVVWSLANMAITRCIRRREARLGKTLYM